MNPPVRLLPDPASLFGQFPDQEEAPEYEVLAPDEVPPPYHDLLVHEHHMTVTVEAHHGALVDVRVLARHRQGDTYARKIVLNPRGSDRVVLFGIVRINLAYCSPAVRDEILAERTPLGRILIEHDVLRRIEPTNYLRFLPGPESKRWFGFPKARTVYGRLAYIHCDGLPAVELLEVVSG